MGLDKEKTLSSTSLEQQVAEEEEIEPSDEEIVDELAAGQTAPHEEVLTAADNYASREDDSASREDDSAARSLVAIGHTEVLRYDPLQAYLNEARRYPLLTPEEEHRLAVKYQETGDLAAARALVTSNLRLVVKIAHEYRRAYSNLLDLVQEGNIGLMQAVKKFDPYRGVKLSSYASWWIRAYILKFILNNWRLVKIGTTQAQRKLFFNLRKEIEALAAQGIDDPGTKLLAQRLEVPEEEVKNMQGRLSGADISLDAPVHDDESQGARRLDFVTAKNNRPDAQVENQQFSQLLQEKLREFGATLRGREKEIFELRTVADEPLTLQEIGDKYHITRERARQLERRMMDRLRDYLRQSLGDAVDVALGEREEE